LSLCISFLSGKGRTPMEAGGKAAQQFYRASGDLAPRDALERDQSTAAGSDCGTLVRHRSYQVRTTPLPAMTKIPVSVHPSGNVPKTTQPASVDHTNCMYVNGAMAEAEARWNAEMKSRCPTEPTTPMPMNAARSEVG